MPSLDLRMRPIDQLQPAPYNPRRPPTAKAREKLRNGLLTFGLVEPLVWNERTGHVVGGHLRLSLLQELGYTEVPVSVVNLDDEHERALNVLLNNLETQGRYDPEKLKTVLESLGELYELTGFEPSMMRNLQLEPLPIQEETTVSDTIELTLLIEKSNWERLHPRIDALIREFDLESHLKTI